MIKTVDKQPRGPMEEAFAKQLKFAMEARRQTPTSLATAVSISSTAARNYLSGAFLPRGTVLDRLQEVLGFRFNLGDPTVFVPEEIAPEKPEAQAKPEPLRLTIAEAKTGLALGLGIDPSQIEILIRS